MNYQSYSLELFKYPLSSYEYICLAPHQQNLTLVTVVHLAGRS